MKIITLKMAARKLLRTFPVFITVFTVLFSSLFLTGMASCFEEYICGKMDLFLYLQADISGRWSYEEVEEFCGFNTHLGKNSYERSDIIQSEDSVYKTAADESFSSILMQYFEGAVIHALNGRQDDEELEELFQQFCYDYKTGEIEWIRNGRVVQLCSDNEFVDLYPYLKLVQGRQFTLEEAETGENVCLIDEEMVQIIKTNAGYSVKKVEPGDTVYLTKKVYNADFTESTDFCLELKVVGVIEEKSINGNLDNEIFIPEKTMERILKEHGFAEVYKDRTAASINYGIGLVNTFKLSSFSQLEKLKKQIDKYKSDNWSYYTSLEKYGYSGMADLVISISKSFRIVSYALIILILLVSAALIVLDINSRRNEIGLLKSMGKEDRDIIRENSVMRVMIYLAAAVPGYFMAVKLSRAVMEYRFINGGTDGSKLMGFANILLKLNSLEVMAAVVFMIILCIESVILYRYLIGRVTVKELLEKQE